MWAEAAKWLAQVRRSRVDRARRRRLSRERSGRLHGLRRRHAASCVPRCPKDCVRRGPGQSVVPLSRREDVETQDDQHQGPAGELEMAHGFSRVQAFDAPSQTGDVVFHQGAPGPQARSTSTSAVSSRPQVNWAAVKEIQRRAKAISSRHTASRLSAHRSSEAASCRCALAEIPRSWMLPRPLQRYGRPRDASRQRG